MAIITEDYVSFNTAKLLKEKGFNEPCYTNYVENEISHYDYSSTNFELIDGIISAPTLQTAMKWLREVHGLFISIGNDDLDYNWQIFDIRNRTKDLDPTCLTDSYAGYKKYELACTLAIKYCLENLI